MFITSFFIAACLSSVTMSDTLEVAAVSADRKIIVSRVDTVSLKLFHGFGNAAEVLQTIPGIQLNDNGGANGLKTVSIRGMGSTHTEVMVDGIRIDDVQGGQIDMGLLGMEEIGAVNIDYVNSRVDLTTARPVFSEGKSFGGAISLSDGYFSTYSPSLKFNAVIAPNVTASIYGSLFNQGDYSTGVNDGQRTIIENSDVRRYRGGMDLFGNLRDYSGDWHVKANAMTQERGCPGSLSWPSNDRQNDDKYFVQGTLRRNVSDVYDFRVNARASYDKMEYISTGTTSHYGQTSFLADSGHSFDLPGAFALKADAGIRYDRLVADTYDAARTRADVKAAAMLNTPSVKAEASLRWLGAFDSGGEVRNCLMPLISARFLLTENFELFASGRRSYRMPTFNDLYYMDEYYLPNPDLKPEDAWMSEAGARMAFNSGPWHFCMTADAYYNYLKDKIVYISDPETWKGTMENLETAESYGVDADFKAGFAAGRLTVDLDARYTLQKGTPIPYQPKHKASASLDAGFNGWMACAAINIHGDAADSYGVILPSWETVDLTLSKTWKRLSLKYMIKNIADRYYEVISGYPMPGTCLIAGLEYKF